MHSPFYSSSLLFSHFFFISLFLFPSIIVAMVNSDDNDIILYEHVNSYQVLQRNPVTNQVSVKTKNGTILTLDVGGPYTIDETITNVMVGDVWVLAGQSNMRGYGFFNQSITNLDPPSMHVFQSNETWGIIRSDQPVHQIASSPRKVHHTLPDPTVRDPSLSLIRGYSLVPSFAHYYQDHMTIEEKEEEEEKRKERKRKSIPIGFIPCAHGGVNLSEWSATKNQGDPHTSLYGAMLDKIKIASENHITGVLWYQGESDAVKIDLANKYESLFHAWLLQLYQEMTPFSVFPKNKLFFIYAQIATTVSHKVDSLNHGHLGWSLVRQAQLSVYEAFKAMHYPIAMLSSINAELDDFIHLSAHGLHQLGQRMAQAAVQLIDASFSSSSSSLTSKPVIPMTLYGTKTTMMHLPFHNTENYYHHILRIEFNHNTLPSSFRWQQKEEASPLSGFSIHDTKMNHQFVDMIFSIKIIQDPYVDVYLTEKGYQLLANNKEIDRYVLYYGFGEHPYCNLISSTKVPAVAFGPLSISVTPLPK